MFCTKFVVIKTESAVSTAFNMFVNKVLLVGKWAIRLGPQWDQIICVSKCFSAMDQDYNMVILILLGPLHPETILKSI